MSSIISSENIKKHNIDKYEFKILNINLESKKKVKESLANQEKNIVKNQKHIQKRETDIITSDIIKLQIKLQKMKHKHKKKLKKIKEKSYAKGIKDGEAKALRQYKKSNIK
ncbi:hypothetical protein CVO_07380 [Sulfurimonas sp. CVO]|uniref:Uncharacterized protein n=1 Tax=Sulfurimonas xiamenensis TaxID=2590021 RepID=A0AAJ4A2L8_9BACT|nr:MULTISPECIES: hypothetical protein [Sulfurimonas]QFR42750.1 hypothetical protein FJR47_02020 [Sulfurimonas xiamenensis]QHG91660.1 hypothetical protein CVO_07380 [Sulfurimonas sp. CVO]